MPLGGLHDTALRQFLKDHPETCRGIITALNNDRASQDKPHDIKGHEASKIIRDRYGSHYTVQSIFPLANDWNDDLRALRTKDIHKDISHDKEKDIEAQIKDYAKQKKLERTKQREIKHTMVRSR